MEPEARNKGNAIFTVNLGKTIGEVALARVSVFDTHFLRSRFLVLWQAAFAIVSTLIGFWTLGAPLAIALLSTKQRPPHSTRIATEAKLLRCPAAGAPVQVREKPSLHRSMRPR